MTTTKTRDDRPNPADPADRLLASECVDWHKANCFTCITTGSPCAGAAENMAFLELGAVPTQREGQTAPQPRTPSAGGAGSGQPVKMANEKQIRYIDGLTAERDVSGVTALQHSVLERGYGAKAIDKLTSRQASDMLDILTQCPRKAPVAASTTSRTQVAPRTYAPREELAAGIYQVGTKIYKVQRAVHGSGKMTCKLLIVDGGGWEYQGLATRFIPAGVAPMTLEQAKEFGRLYGICCHCGATLTDEESIAAGIGPVCAKRFA